MNLFGSNTEDGARFGQNNFAEKAAEIEDVRVNEITLDNSTAAANELFQETMKLAVDAVGRIKEVFRPQFLSRYQNKKIHLATINETDRFVCWVFSFTFSKLYLLFVVAAGKWWMFAKKFTK